MSTLIQKRARNLRKNMTETEIKLWNKLRNRQLEGLRFRRQVPLGNYIVDFACFEPKIIIELDGSQHADQIDYDEKRTKYLEMLGYKVLRFWNIEVANEMNTVLQAIWTFVSPHPACRPPSPCGGRRSTKSDF
jgi:very-short-patch-repair endonuclease